MAEWPHCATDHPAAPPRAAWPPLAGYSAFASRDLDQTREQIARTYCSHDLSIVGREQQLDAWLNYARLGKVGIGAMAYGADVAINDIQEENFLLLMLPMSGSAEIGCGTELIASDPATASVVSARDLKRMRWSHDCSQLVVQIEDRVLEEHAAMMLGRSLRTPLRFRSDMPVGGTAPGWWAYARMLIDELGHARAAGRDSATITQLESLLIVKLLETHENNLIDELQPQGCRILPRHVRKVEHYIDAHADQPLTLEELVAVSGVSSRALFDGFQRFRGTSPMNHVRTVRLRRVRDDLLNARPGETVTSIASRWGFFQFGRFAGQYRKLFGELPSDTLRRA